MNDPLVTSGSEIEGRPQNRGAEDIASQILDAVSDGYQLLDSAWRLTYMNASAREILSGAGLNPDTLLGRGFFEIFPSLRGSRLEGEFERAMIERVPVAFDNYYEPWGRWFSVRAFPVRQGGIAILFHDITARREAEIRERERADELQQLMKAVPAVIWIAHDPECKTISGNPASYELLRIPNGSNASKSHPEIKDLDRFEVYSEGRLLAPEELPVQRAARGEEVRNFEEEVRFTDGTARVLFGNATPTRDAAGNVRGAVAAFIDITERKRAEEALRKSQEQFRSLVDGAPVAIGMSRAGKVLYANPAYRRCFAIPADRELSGTSIFENIAPEEHPTIADRVRQRYEGRPAPRSYEFTGVRADGTRFPAQVEVDQIELPDGPATIAFIYDITERQRTIDELNRANREHQQSRAELEAVVNTMSEGLIVAGGDGKLVFMNRASLRMHHFHSLWEIQNSEGTAVPMERWPVARVLRGETFEQYELLVTRKDTGLRFWGSYSGAPIIDEHGKVRLGVVTISDITPRKEAVQASARLAAIVEFSEDAIISKDLEGRIASWNSGAERLFGYQAAEVLGQPITVLIPPERHAEEKDILARVRAGQVVEPYETVRRCKSGALLDISLSVSPVRDERGKVVGASSIGRDISRRKRAEEALRQAREKLAEYASSLEKTVAERTARLNETVNELQTVSYSIAHDMRAPLRAMGMFAQILMEETGPSLPEQAQDYCRRILTAANRLDKLIHDALNYNKAVLQELPLEPVNLSPLLQGLLETYPNLHPEKAEIKVAAPLPIVRGNESLLTQCFSNLLGNAVKFVPAGRRPRIRVSAERKERSVRVWIEDNGIGIPIEAQGRLFGMFQKLDSSYEGTGIGLAIVRKVVERMGGKVGVVSEEGKGSRFWVDLQLADDAAQARP